MITLDEIRERLKSQHSKISKVAKEAGLHPNAVYRLMREDSKPAYATVKALSDYLEGHCHIKSARQRSEEEEKNE